MAKPGQRRQPSTLEQHGEAVVAAAHRFNMHAQTHGQASVAGKQLDTELIVAEGQAIVNRVMAVLAILAGAGDG